MKIIERLFRKKKEIQKTPGMKLSVYMNLMGISLSELSECVQMDEATLQDILNGKTAWDDVDSFDQFLICSALRVIPTYLAGETENDTRKSRLIRARVQEFVEDFALIREVYESARA